MSTAPAPPPGLLRQLLLRSFTVQASWNYRTLIGTGFAFVLYPLLRARLAEQGRDGAPLSARVAREARLFNSHPYLVPVAAGAVARLEWDGVPPELIDRFKTAIRGALGSLGDQWFWRAWRPACALLGLALLLAGAPWWLAIGAFLVAYNALHLALRVWGIRAGWRHGLQVGNALRAAPMVRVSETAERAAAALAGFAAVVVAGRGVAAGLMVPVAAAALLLGVVLGHRVRIVAALVLLVAVIAAYILRLP